MNKELAKILAGKWAIEPKQMETLCSSGFGEDWLKKSGEVNHKNNTDVKDGIAVIHIDGVLSYRSDLGKAWFGEDTYESIGAAFDAAVNDKSVSGIVLSIDSPGGQISGISDLAEKIFAARCEQKKELGIVAHSAGHMCSAAYWLASACDKVVLSSVGEAGSIGVLCMIDSDVSSEKTTILRSNLSQNKSLDPNTPAGRNAIEESLDSMARVFIESVAKYRGTDFENVFANYGQGKVFVGAEAVKIGMADEIATLDEVVGKMLNHTQIGGNMPTEKTTANPANGAQGVDLDAVRKKAIAAERTRIAGITTAFEGLGLDDECKKFIDDGATVAEAEAHCLMACKSQLKAAKETPATTPAASAQSADANLSAEQKDLIAKGMQASASAANSVQAGSADPKKDSDERAFKAFAAGCKMVR